MVAAAAAATTSPQEPQEKPKSAEQRELEIVSADLDGDGKTIQSTTSFTVTWTDPETGRVHVGTFTAKRPTLGALGQIAVMKAKLNGGENVDAQTDFQHEMMASLHFVLTDVPPWWTPATFYTARPLREVWEYVRRWVDNFHKPRVV